LKRYLMITMLLSLTVGLGCAAKSPKHGIEAGRLNSQDPRASTQQEGSTEDVPSSERVIFAPIYFDFDRYSLREDARHALAANAEVLRKNSGLEILIEGHCDERGTVEYNLALGEKRAKTAKDYLVRLGIEPSRIRVISYGEERPASPGHDERSWALNRRGEFVRQ